MNSHDIIEIYGFQYVYMGHIYEILVRRAFNIACHGTIFSKKHAVSESGVLCQLVYTMILDTGKNLHYVLIYVCICIYTKHL